MNAFRTDVNAWLQSRPHVVVGRSFPFGVYLCTPLLCDDANEREQLGKPIAFLLSSEKYIELVEPDGANQNLWEPLLCEMRRWQISGEPSLQMPSEYWCG
ncbi:MAG: hypothetical protein NZM43_09480 [Saprospiraceae bacterium]|nr:hypothetical protein [Saprospiraceae bacterium]MDW8484546.1 hypothetical protein [Saprospiraceae bacterium]